MFETIIRYFPTKLQPLIIQVLEESSKRELANHRMERDSWYVLKQMGLAFEKYEIFTYRGYVFELKRFRDSPSMYDDPSDYRVKMWNPYPKNQYRKGEKIDNIDFDDCHLSSLNPFIEYLIEKGLPYEFEYHFDWIAEAYEMIERQDMEELQEFLQSIEENFPNKP
jgi:hypothetical protein